MLKKFIKSLLLLFSFTILNAGDVDLDKIVKVAKAQNRGVLIFHHIPGCSYCKAMLDENFKDATILKEIDKNFVYVDIYTADNGVVKFRDFKGSHKEFSAYIGAVAYPATIFMNSEGEVIYRSIGYRNIDEYLLEIKYVLTKSYKTMDLESFIQKQEMEDF
ncbi:thioredoxin family protein [Sulfurospirillum sp. 1307]|jgi:thioredoxin-related protein